MELRTLSAFLKVRHWNRSELARKIGVSRQAVSLWFSGKDRAVLRSSHLLRTAGVLGISAEELDRPLPCLGADHDLVRTELIWDRLFRDIDDFVIALNAGDPRAVGRMVEVYGFYAGEKMIGERVWTEFLKYKRYIHPARRRQLEALHTWNRKRYRTPR